MIGSHNGLTNEDQQQRNRVNLGSPILALKFGQGPFRMRNLGIQKGQGSSAEVDIGCMQPISTSAEGSVKGK